MGSFIERVLRGQAGFTLIEVFITIVLLTIGLLGTAALTTGVVRGNQASRNMTAATAIAQSCLEENRRVGYTSAGAVPPGGSNGCLSGSATVTLNGVSFSRTLAVTPINSTNIRTLTVTVTWSEGSTGSKSITLTTVLAAS
ncbi:MAG TPA: prepilin-type N-terminal cleavage/methylation domain-containing protein [Candidatus Binatia bacterium]|nr:prepilin-type N-terminal cleavage/methylation domain-containing protein [Candidatus Binatia bacterium]